MTIASDDPIRGLVAACSDYYATKDSAQNVVCKVLAEQHYRLVCEDVTDWEGHDDNTIVPFCRDLDGRLHLSGYVNFSWHKCLNGLWEFTIYVSL